MKALHYSIIAILIFTAIMVVIIEFPIYQGPNALITGSKPYQETTFGNSPTNSTTLSHGIPSSTEIGFSFNGTQPNTYTTFHVKQGQNVTLVVKVTSDPTNLPVTLYTQPHIGFTGTNGLDFKFSSTYMITPDTVLLHVLIGKDATPNSYRTRVFATTEGGPGSMSMGDDIGIIVMPQDNDTQKLQNTSIFDTGVTPMSANVAGTNFTVNYNIIGAKVSEIKREIQSESLTVSLKTTGDGQMVINIPRELIDSKTYHNNEDDSFIVLADGQEIKIKEIHANITDRTLLIPFQNGTSKIEIIGTSPI